MPCFVASPSQRATIQALHASDAQRGKTLHTHTQRNLPAHSKRVVGWGVQLCRAQVHFPPHLVKHASGTKSASGSLLEGACRGANISPTGKPARVRKGPCAGTWKRPSRAPGKERPLLCGP